MTPIDDFRGTLRDLFRARFPYVYVRTHEEERLLAEVKGVAAGLARSDKQVRVLSWSLTEGMRGATERTARARVGDATEAALRALGDVEELDEPAFVVLRDFHWFFGIERRPPDQRIIRRIRDLAPHLRDGAVHRTIVFVAPEAIVPGDLDKDVHVVDLPLPGALELDAALQKMIDDNRGSVRDLLTADGHEQLVKAALGLTQQEAENAFARAMANDRKLTDDDRELVLAEKRQAVQRTEVLEYVEPAGGFEQIGGLRNLRQWLAKRENSWLDAARDWGVPYPKGVLITGVPGCGKSLTAKCTSHEWGLPLLRLDVGRIFSGLVGSSEQNMRAALRTADAMSPAVLWIDEIEKGFGHTRGGERDGGTASRVFATFLTWMQEKQSFVFVIATANSIAALPPEFVRKGRFDEVFFVDLPTHTERERIFDIHLRRRLSAPQAGGRLDSTPDVLYALAEQSEGYSGAEIEEALVAAMFEAYAERRPLELEDVTVALHNLVPLSVTQAEQIMATREWAERRAVIATPSSDREGYGEPSVTGDVAHARGGRTIDF